MGSIHSATIQDRGRRRCRVIPKSPRKVVPIHPQPTLAELGLFAAHLTIDPILFGDNWGREPSVVGRKLKFGPVVLVSRAEYCFSAFNGRRKRRRGIGDGVVGTFVEEETGHEGGPQGMRKRKVWRTPRTNCARLERRETGAVVNKRRSY